MKRILASTRAPMLLSLLLLGACASHNHAELSTLESAQQETHREVVAVRAQLETLNARLADMDNKAHAQPRHVSRQRPYSDVDVDTKPFDDNVRSTGEFSYEIKRSFVNKLLANPSTLTRAARIVPSIKDGKANGFKIYAVRPNSLYARIGFLNGDTLHRINGKELNTLDRVLESYSEWLTASTLSVDITRRGKQETISISISG